jgi:hypothetical protein
MERMAGGGMRIKAIGVAPTPDITAETVVVEHFPPCDLHLEQSDEQVLARFAGFTIFETHAFMCVSCFNLYGMGLGPGKGQRLVIGA